jgi:hypothetical protein
LSKTNGKKETIDKIKRWINEEELNSNTSDDPYADFHTDIRFGSSKVNLIISKNKVDSIIVCTKSVFSVLDQKAFSGLSKDNKRSFMLGLKFSLSRLNIQYAIAPDENKVESIYMQKVVYFDGLSKDRLFEVIMSIVSAISIVNLTYEKYLHPN